MVQDVKVEADTNAKGDRVLMNVVIFEEVRIGTATSDRRVELRGDRFMSEYIYNRCSGSP